MLWLSTRKTTRTCWFRSPGGRRLHARRGVPGPGWAPQSSHIHAARTSFGLLFREGGQRVFSCHRGPKIRTVSVSRSGSGNLGQSKGHHARTRRSHYVVAAGVRMDRLFRSAAASGKLHDTPAALDCRPPQRRSTDLVREGFIPESEDDSAPTIPPLLRAMLAPSFRRSYPLGYSPLDTIPSQNEGVRFPSSANIALHKMRPSRAPSP